MHTHPQLAKKLFFLYGALINPDITCHAQLARCLGITKQGVSKWINGTDTSPGNKIPRTQLQKVADFFYLEPITFTLPFEEFEEIVLRLIEKLAVDKISRPEKLSLSQLPVTDLDIVGRQEELGLLNGAWERSKFNLVQIVAFGGVGKSSLVNKWLSSISGGNYQGAKKVYAWSFTWQGSESDENSSGDFFIEHALEWFGDESPDEGTPWSKATRLANLIRASKTLLILDGLEPLLTAPRSNSGEIQNPAVASLIKELAAENNGLCVITTRLRIADIASFEDKRVKTIELKNLDQIESRKLLKNMGIHGTNTEFENATTEYSGHPLSLSLLGGYLSVVHDGEVGKFRELTSLFETENLDSHAGSIVNAYLRLFRGSPELAILNMLGIVDRQILLSELKNLCSRHSVENLTFELNEFSHSRWKYALHSLEKCKLVSIEKFGDDHSVDCHPLVRDYLIYQLKKDDPELWKIGNRMMFEYLQAQATEKPDNLVDLEPLFRAVIYGTRAGMYEEAFQIYFERIKLGFSMLPRGSHYLDQACLRSFFAEEWTTPVKRLQDKSKFHLIMSAATNLMSLGQIEKAMEPWRVSIDWFVTQELWTEAASAAGPYASMLISAGKLDDAKKLHLELKECVEKTENEVLLALSQCFRAYTYHLSGLLEEAEKLFDSSEKVLKASQPNSNVCFPTVSSFYIKFLLDTGQVEKAWERSRLTFQWRENKSWQVEFDTTSLYGSDLLFHGLICQERGDSKTAEKLLDQQVNLFREANEWLYLPTGLNYRAKYFIQCDRLIDAARDLKESLSISMRTGAKLEQWETYLNYAHLHLKRRKPRLVRRYLNKAARLDGMSSYKFRDHEIDELEVQLKLLKREEKT